MTGELENQGAPDGETDAFRAGYLAGWSDRQGEIEHLESVADILYRVAHGEERRPQTFTLITRAELEARRNRPRPEPVTREQALASWGITLTDAGDPAPETEVAPEPVPSTSSTPLTTNRRRTAMSTRTITGNLAADPESVQAGRVQIVKLRVIENTGEYRQGVWTEHDAATTHFVETKFDLGQNVLASLHKGDAVIVIGSEHTVSWGEGEGRRYGRVIDADHVGPNLARATAQVTRNPRTDAD